MRWGGEWGDGKRNGWGGSDGRDIGKIAAKAEGQSHHREFSGSSD